MPWSSPQHKQFSGQLVFLVFVLNVSLCWRMLPAEIGENSICPVLNLRVPPRVGANRRVCIAAFCLRCWYLGWLKHLFDTFYFWEWWRQRIGILCGFVAVATEWLITYYCLLSILDGLDFMFGEKHLNSGAIKCPDTLMDLGFWWIAVLPGNSWRVSEIASRTKQGGCLGCSVLDACWTVMY